MQKRTSELRFSKMANDLEVRASGNEKLIFVRMFQDGFKFYKMFAVIKQTALRVGGSQSFAKFIVIIISF